MSEYIIKAAEWAIDYNGDSLYKNAEEIVRCRDCRYYQPYIYFNFTCELLMFNMTPNDFCSQAERKQQ